MNDAELIRLCAERVMGWTRDGAIWRDGEGTSVAWVRDAEPNVPFTFDPLHDDAAAGQVLDRMEGRGLYACVFYSPYQGVWQSRFTREWPGPMEITGGPGAKGRRRAIVMAALRAEEEDTE